RCVAKYAFEHGLTKSNPMRVETGNGVLTLHLQVEARKVQRCTVNLGRPIFESKNVPVDLPVDRVIDYPLPNDDPRDVIPSWWEQCGLDPRITCVNTGNPHVVLFCADLSQGALAQIGPGLENHRIFPDRANVHFAQVISRDELRMRTWERGSGVT